MYNVGIDIWKNGFNVMGGSSQEVKNLRVMQWVFVFIFLVFILRLLFLSVSDLERKRLGLNTGQWLVERTDIVDRNGELLAKNIMSGDIVLRPQNVKDKEKAARFIYELFPDKYSLAKSYELLNSSRRFIYLEKDSVERKRNAVTDAKISGIDVETKQTRVYPKSRLFAHSVGFVGADGYGLEGAEKIYDKYLLENDDPLQLSLDSRIQSIFYRELSIAMQRYKSLAAMGVLMDARTGEMIAMVSLPDFDPENRSLDPVENRVFKPIRSVYEMGSVFKVFNTAMAYEYGITDEFYIEKPFEVLDKFGRVATRISDHPSFKPPRPYLGVDDILMYSCNPGSAQIALTLPDGTQQEFLSRINMDKPLQLEFGKTERVLMPQKWGPVEKVTVSYGHGISVTPMHLFLGFNSMVNGGYYIYPTLQKRQVGKIYGSKILDTDISAKINQTLYRVVEETSAKKAKVAGINIGGKTGTAEKYTNGKVDRRRNMTVFVAAFPIEAPQYTMMIVLDEPKGLEENFYLKTAAWNAVPTAGTILEDILPLLFQ